ncbi:hypothetical protein V5O48_004125 [Marasmius crinis-equi]|uniref:Uncharacterized protein n=1 Tax=Marasmius crinis-equi TaxID=585013 RepID=A0ABR3FRV8_9AGAR
MSTTTTATPSASSSAAADGSISANSNLRIVGIILAISSGLLIGVSYVVKKKGLIKSQAGGVAGEGVAYLKSWLWWSGMILMILGELCNFAGKSTLSSSSVILDSFSVLLSSSLCLCGSPDSRMWILCRIVQLVTLQQTPLGALSVVICAVLSSMFLKEKLTFFGWLGCGLCIIGSTIIALNSPSHSTVGEIREFQKLFLAPGFLAWGGVLIVASLVIIFIFAPKYGNKSMMWYISVCSMIGALSVSVTTGLGAAIITSIKGDNQFKYWFMYFLLVFVIVTLLTEVYYLNKALALFNTAMVTPTYYVIFTTFTLVTTVVLFKGLDADAKEIITIVLGFFTICVGITILQMSKVDPEELSTKLDRRSTILLQAARQNTQNFDEKDVTALEDPGIDALRGSFGTIGSIVRARSARRMSQSSRTSAVQPRPPGAAAAFDPNQPWLSPAKTNSGLPGMRRHQLYDPPMPASPSVAGATKGDDDASMKSAGSQILNKRPTIKFDNTDVVHQYHPPVPGSATRMDVFATHGTRPAQGSPGPTPKQLPGSGADAGYPLRPINTQTKPEEKSLLFSDPDSPDDSPSSMFGGRSPDEPQTAPPTLAYQRFRPGAQVRKDSREIFPEDDNRETMLTFPSVTDSARSWDEEARIEGSGSGSRPSSSRGRPEKRYPARPGDNREESVGLVNKGDRDRTPTPPSADELEAHGGIRLVTSSSQLNRF